MAASVRGPQHAATNKVKEDAFAIEIITNCAIAVVCDGAGSAPLAAAGAQGFSAAVKRMLMIMLNTRKIVTLALFRKSIIYAVDNQRNKLIKQGHTLNDHHTTLVALLAMPDKTLIAHVGDGIAGVALSGDWRNALLSEPENGEYSNETFFVTEEHWQDHLRCTEVAALTSDGAAVVLTDGAMPFVVGSDGGLDAEFMSPVSKFLASSHIDEAAIALAGTLDSKDARKISSDDKTFIWISNGNFS